MERNIKLMALFNFFTDFKLYSAVEVIYFARITGSYALAMSLFSVIFISSAIFEIPTGIYSDKIGRRKTIIWGAISAVIFSVFYAIGINYWFLFVGALFEGLSRSFYSGNNDAFLHDSLKSLGKKEYYGHYFGRISAMFQAALTVGAVLGSIIANWSFFWIMWLSVIPQICCFAISLILTEPPDISPINTNIYAHLSGAFSRLWKNKRLRLLSFNQILSFGIGESTFEFNTAFIASVWPIWAIGISKMISYIGGGVSYWYSSKLIKRFGGIKLMIFDSIYNRIANLIAVIYPSVLSPLFMSTTSFLYGVTEVSSNSLMQKEFTDSERATLSSIASLIGSVFFGIYSIILGIVADAFTPAGAILFAQFCSIPRIYILWLLKQETNKYQEYV
jgi:MFS family permease